MAFYERACDREPYRPALRSWPSAIFDGTGIVLAAAIGVALIMMSFSTGDADSAGPTFKTPPPPSESTSPGEPTPKPTTEPTPQPATEPTLDPTTEPTPNPTTEPRPTQAPQP